MLDIIPLVIIFLSLLVVIFIVVRKFSALAALDVENLPIVKEGRFKEQIISNRLKRKLTKWTSKISRWIMNASNLAGKGFVLILKKLEVLKEQYRSEEAPLKRAGGAAEKEKMDRLLNEYLESYNKEDFQTAEKSLIEVISLDSKNIKAFKNLGELYSRTRQFTEARQTLEHILKLIEVEEVNAYRQASSNGNQGESQELARERAKILIDLALACRESGDNKDALKYNKKALEIEPNNPRYLDSMLEISIILKDKISAFDALKKLEEVNPENNKISDFKEKISKF
jgi:tetratricopeptide (TPR) repeat protein